MAFQQMQKPTTDENTPPCVKPHLQFADEIIACKEQSTSYSLQTTCVTDKIYNQQRLNNSGEMDASPYNSNERSDQESLQQPHASPYNGTKNCNKTHQGQSHSEGGCTTQYYPRDGGQFSHLDHGCASCSSNQIGVVPQSPLHSMTYCNNEKSPRAYTGQGQAPHFEGCSTSHPNGGEGSRQCLNGTYGGEQSNSHSSCPPNAMNYDVNTYHNDESNNNNANRSHTHQYQTNMSQNSHNATGNATCGLRAVYVNAPTASTSSLKNQQYMCSSPVDIPSRQLITDNNISRYVSDMSNLSTSPADSNPFGSVKCGSQATSSSTVAGPYAAFVSKTTSQERSMHEPVQSKAVKNGSLTLKDIKKVAENVGKGYESLAIELDIEQTDIDKIKADYVNNMEQQIMAMLKMWKNNAGEGATKKVLLDAIMSTKSLSRNMDPLLQILR